METLAELLYDFVRYDSQAGTLRNQAASTHTQVDIHAVRRACTWDWSAHTKGRIKPSRVKNPVGRRKSSYAVSIDELIRQYASTITASGPAACTRARFFARNIGHAVNQVVQARSPASAWSPANAIVTTRQRSGKNGDPNILRHRGNVFVRVDDPSPLPSATVIQRQAAAVVPVSIRERRVPSCASKNMPSRNVANTAVHESENKLQKIHHVVERRREIRGPDRQRDSNHGSHAHPQVMLVRRRAPYVR